MGGKLEVYVGKFNCCPFPGQKEQYAEGKEKSWVLWTQLLLLWGRGIDGGRAVNSSLGLIRAFSGDQSWVGSELQGRVWGRGQRPPAFLGGRWLAFFWSLFTKPTALDFALAMPVLSAAQE